MADLEKIIDDIEDKSAVSFSRSGGPGGQNVNKLNTKVLLSVPIEDLSSLSENEKQILREKLSGRINSSDEIFVQSASTRSQLKNRKEAVKRLALIIKKALTPVRKRKRTKPSRSSVEKRLQDKKRKSEIKKSRRSPF